VTGREIQPHDITNTGTTPKNGHDGWSFPFEICSFLKAARLMKFSDAPPSIKMWYNLTLAMARETSSGTMLLLVLGLPPQFLGARS
jgi:hypothetical protein